MENCLVTKLKATVDNNNLLKMGEVRIHVTPKENPIAADIQLQLKGSSDIDVNIVGNGYFSETASGTTLGTHLTHLTIEPNPIPKDLYFSYDTEYDISLTGKYDFIYLNVISALPSIFSIDAGYVKYSTGLTTISIPLTGNIADISALTSNNSVNIRKSCGGDIISLQPLSGLRYFRSENNNLNIEGNIDVAFGSLTSLESCIIIGCKNITGTIETIGKNPNCICNGLYGSGLTGTVEGFVANRVAAGVTSPSSPIEFAQILALATFGGTLYNDTAGGIITWNGTSKIIVYTHGANAQTATQVYAKGATAEEIAAWEQAGKTVTVVE